KLSGYDDRTNDRQSIRETAPPPAPANAQPMQPPPPVPPNESPGATVRLSSGEALAAPSGRADDFSWPRGVVNVEPATADLAAPETAPADAGAKSAKPAQRKSAMDAYAAHTDREHKPAQRRPRPRLNHNVWAHPRTNVPSFGPNGW